jgi:imidazolonepropionase-like amidohydrolase
MTLLLRLAVFGIAWVAAVASAQTLAITGAKVHTAGPDGTLENASIIVSGARIVAVGADVTIPADATIIDANGLIVTPGLFSPVGQLGLSEVSAVIGSNDATQRGEQFSAAFDVASAYNPRSMVVAVSRVDGITRAAITPIASEPDPAGNVSNVLSGLGSIVHLGDTDDFIVRHGAVLVANMGEAGGVVAGGSRAAAVLVLRSALDDALEYRQNRTAADRGDWRDFSVSRADLNALQAVLDRSTPLLVNVNRASDIRVVLDIAADYNIRVIIGGGAEAWMVAADIAAQGVPVILDGINNLPNNFDQINARLDSAAMLVAAGVAVAFEAGSLGPGGQTHNARNITQAAGIAVANGLSWDEALRAITLVPAQIYGVDATLGSIEVGKDADLVVWGDDPLELSSYPEQVFIRGESINLQSRHTLLRDRYLQTDSALPPAYRT